MKPTCLFLVILRCSFLIWLMLSRSLWAQVTMDTVTDLRFGRVAIYHPAERPKGLLLLLSGDGGWDAETTKLAEAAAQLDYLVAGLDSNTYSRAIDGAREPCLDLADALQTFGRLLVTRYRLSPHKPPILMGLGSAAALVYAALAQAPVSAFHAGISVDFCPRLLLRKPLCGGRTLRVSSAKQGSVLLPSTNLRSGWFVFESGIECSKDAAAFVNRVDNGRWVSLPGKTPKSIKSSGEQSQLLALLQWLDPGIANQVTTESELTDLPLTEVPSISGSIDRVALMLSGDGGWAALDRGVASELARHGIATVGWDSLSYFWNVKTPDQAALDLARVLRHYMQAWNKSRALLVGYSFGADVLPFMASRLPPDLKEKVALMAFLGLGKNASFEFHLSDWIGGTGSTNTLPIQPEVAKLGWVKRLCIFGVEESDSGCPPLAQEGVVVLQVPGDHHFDEDYKGIAQRILQHIPP